jgi:hypothetical protein
MSATTYGPWMTLGKIKLCICFIVFHGYYLHMLGILSIVLGCFKK